MRACSFTNLSSAGRHRSFHSDMVSTSGKKGGNSGCPLTGKARLYGLGSWKSRNSGQSFSGMSSRSQACRIRRRAHCLGPRVSIKCAGKYLYCGTGMSENFNRRCYCNCSRAGMVGILFAVLAGPPAGLRLPHGCDLAEVFRPALGCGLAAQLPQDGRGFNGY